MLSDPGVEIVRMPGIVTAVRATEEIGVEVQRTGPSIRVFARLSPYSG
ncbi:MAG: hypothetical protein JWO81_16 [Alphaproteobacteria bacterium]|nr:hypothetical protein [Alphaproteobacteria bacterium]